MREVIATLESLLGHTLEVVYTAAAPGDARHTAADVTKATRDLGFVAATKFADGLRAQLEASRSFAAVSHR